MGQSIQTDYRLNRLFLKGQRRNLRFFLTPEPIFDILTSRGLSSVAALDAAQRFAQTARFLKGIGMRESEEVAAFWVPGRIELLGKHTDYAGGGSIVGALERGVAVIAGPSGEGLRVYDVVDSSMVCLEEEHGQHASMEMHWGRYPSTVWKRVRDNFDLPHGEASIGFASNLPRAAGMSSSSALMIAVYLALHVQFSIGSSPRFAESIVNAAGLADYLGHIENGQSYNKLKGDAGVGTFGGSQDHAAILLSRSRHVSWFSFLPTRHLKDLLLPEDSTLVIACSGVKARKTGEAKAKYNEASRRVRELLDIWTTRSGNRPASLAAVFDDPDFSLESFAALLPRGPGREELENRLAQCYGEVVENIPSAVDALASDDVRRFGSLVDRSQQMAEDLLGNQIPETSFLAREARSLGAVAASAFGAGFGGSVWAMVERHSADEFLARWRDAYSTTYPAHRSSARFFIDDAGPGAFEVG